MGHTYIPMYLMAENPRNEDEIPIKSARLYHQPATRYHSVGYMYVYIYIYIPIYLHYVPMQHPHLSPLCPHAAAPFKGGCYKTTIGVSKT